MVRRLTASLGPRLDELLDRTVVGSYTNAGFLLRSRCWDGELPTMEGKTVVVTGATSGLGRAAAARLAGLGGPSVPGRTIPRI